MIDEKVKEQLQAKLAANIRYLLNVYSYNALEISKKLKISYATIHGIISGNLTPTLETLLKITKYFNINLSQITGELPFIANKNFLTIRSLPIINLNNVVEYLNSDIDYKSYSELSILVSTNTNISEKAFALIINKEITPKILPGSLLYFDQINDDLVNYDNKIVITMNKDHYVNIEKLIFNNSRCYLNNINIEAPNPILLQEDIKILAYLFQGITYY